MCFYLCIYFYIYLCCLLILFSFFISVCFIGPSLSVLSLILHWSNTLALLHRPNSRQAQYPCCHTSQACYQPVTLNLSIPSHANPSRRISPHPSNHRTSICQNPSSHFPSQPLPWLYLTAAHVHSPFVPTPNLRHTMLFAHT